MSEYGGIDISVSGIIDRLRDELDKVKEQLSQEIMKNVELEKKIGELKIYRNLWKEGNQQKKSQIRDLTQQLNNVKANISEFFSILDAEEESGDGNIFHPVRINSCRTTESVRISEIFKQLKQYLK